MTRRYARTETFMSRRKTPASPHKILISTVGRSVGSIDREGGVLLAKTATGNLNQQGRWSPEWIVLASVWCELDNFFRLSHDLINNLGNRHRGWSPQKKNTEKIFSFFLGPRISTSSPEPGVSLLSPFVKSHSVRRRWHLDHQGNHNVVLLPEQLALVHHRLV